MRGLYIRKQIGFIRGDILHPYPFELVVHRRIEDQHLILHPHRRVLALAQHRDDALALGKPLPRVAVEVGAELRERLQLPVLRIQQLERPRHFFHRFYLRRAAHAGHRDARVDSRADARMEQLALEEDLPVGD